MHQPYSSFIILLLTLHCTIIKTSELQPLPYQQTPYQPISHQPFLPYPIHFHVSPQSHANAHVNNQEYSPITQQNHMNATQISEHKLIHVHTIDLDIKNPFPSLLESCRKKQLSITPLLDTIIEHKGKIIFCVLGACYGYFYYELNKTNKLLNEINSWCNWKQAITLQHLTSATYSDLIQELLVDIHKKYLLITDSKNQITFYDHFIQEIIFEKTTLQKYNSILPWVEKLYISKILPNTINQEIITEKLTRIDFIINLFLIWQNKQNNM